MTDKGTKTLLDAIAYAEGHGKRLDYSATYGHGKYTKGERPITEMTLDEVRSLQDRMLSRQRGRLKSSAVGRYQFIRKTFDATRKALELPGGLRFSPDVQDQMAMRLLEKRGFSQWREGHLSRAKFQNNFAYEWASIPNTKGKSQYGQGVGISQEELDWALDRAGDTTPLRERATDKPVPSTRQPDDPGTHTQAPERHMEGIMRTFLYYVVFAVLMFLFGTWFGTTPEGAWIGDGLGWVVTGLGAVIAAIWATLREQV